MCALLYYAFIILLYYLDYNIAYTLLEVYADYIVIYPQNALVLDSYCLYCLVHFY